MAEYLTTTGASAGIERIIRTAKERIIICSPFLKISKIFYERLLEADNKNVEIFIIYGKSELNEDEYDKITNLNNIYLYYLHELHAKCYANENSMIITSMNFFEFSQENNREMGIFIDRKKDKDLFEDALDELRAIRDLAEEERIEGWGQSRGFKTENNKRYRYNTNEEHLKGFCIRCRDRITIATDYPYCDKCYSVWVQFQNPLYEENYCQKCGRQNNSTKERPLCFSCYKELQDNF
ncbi:phospholipase D family protein [Spirochaeta isovalerica]|uniref:Phosphatidylserine/phosphatidylglycerophosphate/ cardiolipin synthase-like enzyme n=1 Tax=Spirochaeta isovalerica TaxID=150 RepID=A0A841RGS1_9SPIO|nr:phospholipase D family protein [Spirochaeta isovalerica]MBB6481522.1 phosphatidylserine/phosphatidylglycerophosphate/cardiolipin synthase-like enzyme [Spirochaeta isovalerica]